MATSRHPVEFEAAAAPAALAAPMVIAGRGQIEARLAGIERGWKQLWREAQPANPFLSWEWQRNWLAGYAGQVEPLLVALPFADGRLAGLLALQRTRQHGLWRVEMLAQGSDGDEWDCLLHPEAPAATAGRLLRAALRQRRWDWLEIESIPPAGPLAAALTALGARGEAGPALPYMALPATMAALLDRRSANFRSEVRRRQRRFGRLADGARLECVDSPAAMRAGLAELFRLHNRRRAHRGERGVYESAEAREFHLRAAAQLAAVRGCRLYLLCSAGAVVAALYGLVWGRRFLYYQSGFEPALAELSPGTVLLAGVAEDCIRRGERQFDFLRGEEAYKSRWTETQRPTLRLALAASVGGRGYLRLRPWWRRWRGGRQPT